MLVLASFGGWFFNKGGYKRVEEVGYGFYQPDRISGMMGANPSAAEREWASARAAYNRQDLDMAMPILEKFATDRSLGYFSKANFFLGHVYMQQEKADKAVACFDAVRRESGHWEPARFYLGLALLAGGKAEKGREGEIGIPLTFLGLRILANLERKLQDVVFRQDSAVFNGM